jgi:hypothetical protein
MAAAQPDRRMRLLQGLGSHGAAFGPKDAPSVADFGSVLDELDPFSEPPHAMIPGPLELRVVVVPA